MEKVSTPKKHPPIHHNTDIYEEYFDVNYSKSIVENIFNLIDEVYFRTEFIGFDEPIERNNPDHPVILASNHSGMAFPWDAIMFVSMFYKRINFDMSLGVATLTSPMLSQTTLMNPYLIPNFWKRCGGIDATYSNFETMMHVPKGNLLVYPEGVPGIGKGFNRRYQLQRFATSFIRLAIKYKTDIVPYSTVNAEYIDPYTYSFDWINKWTRKIGIPFLPIGMMTILVILFPFFFYFAFPAKIKYVRGRRIRPYDLTDKPYDELTNEEIKIIRDKVKERMQEDLNKAVEKYGQDHYNYSEHFKMAWKKIKLFPFYSPLGWPFLFAEFQRVWKKNNGKDVKIKYGLASMFRMLFQNPFTIVYFIPILGWIPFMIIGYKGQRLTKNGKK
ncbi:MAG: hypothetical protein GY705_15850 [Bacteroidetes bacterium]|nr:hypothetical protein [Bacteroidota bacterium]